MLKSTYKKLVSEKRRIDIRLRMNKLTSVFYLGNRYHCNCCNRSFRKFLPKGNVRRENAKCPYCGSLERTRLLFFYLKNETGIFRNQGLRLLHFAPEQPLFDILETLNIEYVDGDINPSFARNVIDVTSIPYSDNYFDFIICAHVLGHVPDEGKAIEELFRVTKKNGTALVMTLLNLNSKETYENPEIVTEKERLAVYGEPDLCRLHGQDFENRLQNGGFTVERIDYRTKLPQEIAETYRLGDGRREIIFKCTKPGN